MSGHSGHSIFFQAGPYRGWGFALDAWSARGDRPAMVTAQIEPPRHTGPANRVTFLEGSDGYDALAAAMNGHGRPALEDGLQWLLDATETALGQPAPLGAEQRWTYWQEIVAAGRDAVAGYRERYPDGVEPAFEVVYSNVA